MKNRNVISFYIAVALYALYVFLSNWGLSAEKMGSIWLHEAFSVLANFIILPACSIFIIYKIASDFKFYAKYKWFTIVSIAFAVFLALSVGNVLILLPLLLGFAGIRTDNRITAKVILAFFGSLLVASCVLSLLGLNGGNTASKPLFGDDGYYSVAVTALGLSNPNSVMLIFTNIIILSLYLCKTKRQNFIVSTVLFALIIFISSVTGSTTGLVIGATAIVLISLAKRSKKALKLFRKIAPWAFVLVTAAAFMIAASFGSQDNIPNPVNDTLTNRAYMWNLRIENSSYVNIYGDNDQYQAENVLNSNATLYALDNMPLYILVHWGVIIYLVFFYIFYSGSKKLTDPVLIVYVLITCMLMFVERMYLYSPILIFLQKAITEYYLVPGSGTKKRKRLYV